MKILAFSSIRSDYDILSPLYLCLNQDPQIDFKILVSGTHLSLQYGYSLQEIQKDQLPILAQIETLLASDTPISRLKSASLLLQNSLETIQHFKPDLLIYGGDREDVLIYAMISGYLNIPSIHFYGGDFGCDGYIDNPVRHATSKLSTFHFVSLNLHAKRLVAMGEDPKRIYQVGSIGLDKFKNFSPIDKEKIFAAFNRPVQNRFALLIFHPITGEMEKLEEIYEAILQSLKQSKIPAFVSYPNSDFGNHRLIASLKQYTLDPNFIFFKNLDRKLFLSIYKHSCFIIGNSSSGICEAASIPIPAINVGQRQRGRFSANNVIFCDSTQESILKAIARATSEEFLNSIANLQNPYGDGQSTQRAYHLIKTLNFHSLLAKTEDPLDILPPPQYFDINLASHKGCA